MKKFLTIPQKNSENLDFSKLIALQKEEKIKFDLTYDLEKDTFKIAKEFIANNSENSGFTALITEDVSELLLLQTDDSSEKELQPKFLKGVGVSPIFKSNWFKQLIEWRGYIGEKGFFLNKKYIEELDMFGYEVSLKKEDISLINNNSVLDEFLEDTELEIDESYQNQIAVFEN